MSSSTNSSTNTDSRSQDRAEKAQHLHYLNEFRVEACPLFKQHQCQQHRPYTCFNWHFANQRRRRPTRKGDGTFNYSPDIYCDKYDENTGICPDGDECVFLHRVSGDVERKYHLRYYKTAQCVHPTDARGQCVKNGAHCAFAHSSSDLRLPQFDQHEAGFATTIEGEGRDKTSFVIEDQSWHSQDHVLSCYKTEQCRKPARLCRQGYACPFYHNNRDRRRPPALFKYRSTPCPAAKTADEWLDPEQCEAQDNCQYCHTRTEQQFHPEIYKSTKCNDMLEHGYCPRAVFCAFAHHDSELHVQRTPYLASTQASPKEQCSPNTNGTFDADALRFGSPVPNGNTGPPTYSAVLKHRQSLTKPPFSSATTDHLPSSYAKAPGFERGPLSPNRNDSALGRLRTHSLNMGNIDIAARNDFTGFEGAPGTSLPSHSSLCRSDSGFHAVAGTLEELSLDLAPIDENGGRQLTDLFGSTNQLCYNQMSSPMRIPGGDSFHTSPLTSFAESLFGSSKQQLNSPAQNAFGGFDNQIGETNSDIDDFLKSQSDYRNHQEKVAAWELGLKQAREACEAWRNEANALRKRTADMELERNRAIFERDQMFQQLEALKLHMQSNSLSGLSAPNMGVPPPDYSEGLLRAAAAIQNQQPFSMFSESNPMGPACARCGRDRTRNNNERNGCRICTSK